MAQKVTIGRDPANTIKVDESFDTVSNEHASLFLDGNDELIYEDHSSNGTVINGQKIQNTRVHIFPGDDIRLANVYTLDWADLRRFFPTVKRATAAHNNRAAGAPSDGHATMRFASAEEAAAVADDTASRGTERFSAASVSELAEAPEVKEQVAAMQARRSSSGGSRTRRKPASAKGILIWLAIFLAIGAILAIFIFDDLIKEIL